MFRACLEFRMSKITRRYRYITKNDRNTNVVESRDNACTGYAETNE